eukprot:scaffold54298_cov44-Phaeocystis_antarctica.AAC.4
MKMRTSALVGGQQNRACALVDRRLRDLGQAVDAKRMSVRNPSRPLSQSRCAAEDPETLLRPSSREFSTRIC